MCSCPAHARTCFYHLNTSCADCSKPDLCAARVASQVATIGNVNGQRARRVVTRGVRCGTVARRGTTPDGQRRVLGPYHASNRVLVRTIQLHMVSELNDGIRRDHREGCRGPQWQGGWEGCGDAIRRRQALEGIIYRSNVKNYACKVSSRSYEIMRREL